MGRYRKIDPKFWNDEKVRAMSDRAKLSSLFVFTHPSMTALGAMRATMPGLASELGWTLEAFREAFGEASVKGILEADEKACFVAAPNFLKYNAPESPNVVKAWVGAWDLIPECEARSRLLQRVKGFVEAMSEDFREAFRKAFPQAFAKAMPNPEPEPEPEPEQKPEPKPSPASRAQSEQAAADAMSANRIYQTYPRHVGKSAAEKAIVKALHLIRARGEADPAAWLLERVKQYAEARQGEDPKYTPHPATWFNHMRFDDDANEWTHAKSNGQHKPAPALCEIKGEPIDAERLISR